MAGEGCFCNFLANVKVTLQIGSHMGNAPHGLSPRVTPHTFLSFSLFYFLFLKKVNQLFFRKKKKEVDVDVEMRYSIKYSHFITFMLT